MKPQTFEEILEQDFKDNMQLFPLDNRRDFIKKLGGGIFIFVSLVDMVQAADAAGRQRGGGGFGRAPSDFNAYLRIGEDGRITGYTGKIEMGQGPFTSLPQELAEELDVSLDKVDLVMGDTDLCPWDQGTHGSMTTRMFGQAMRTAAAEARSVLLEMAAEKLQVPQQQLALNDGVIFDSQAKDHKVTYAELAKGQKISRHLNSKADLKQPSSFKVIGKSQLRRDAHDKVTGKAQYAGDIR